MQPNGPQFVPSGGYSPGVQADAGQAQFMTPQTWQQPYAQQPYAQPPYAQQPYAQQPYAQLPYAQQPYAQQPYAQQPAPLAPVSCPAYVPPGQGQQQAAPQQSVRQAYQRQIIGVARSLEEVIPGYQVLVSVLQDVLAGRGAEALAESETVVDALKDGLFQHFAALGAIRRFLCGETTTEVLTALALSVTQLVKIHAQTRPLFERLVMNATPEARASLTSLAQTVSAADTHLTQAASAVQATVGPQVWEAARVKVHGDTAPTT